MAVAKAISGNAVHVAGYGVVQNGGSVTVSSSTPLNAASVPNAGYDPGPNNTAFNPGPARPMMAAAPPQPAKVEKKPEPVPVPAEKKPEPEAKAPVEKKPEPEVVAEKKPEKK